MMNKGFNIYKKINRLVPRSEDNNQSSGQWNTFTPILLHLPAAYSGRQHTQVLQGTFAAGHAEPEH